MAADVGLAELRERRKQKILLNTEQRMNKLLGYKTEEEGFTRVFDVSATVREPEINGVLHVMKSSLETSGFDVVDSTVNLLSDDEINNSERHINTPLEADSVSVITNRYAASEEDLHQSSINLHSAGLTSIATPIDRIHQARIPRRLTSNSHIQEARRPTPNELIQDSPIESSPVVKETVEESTGNNVGEDTYGDDDATISDSQKSFSRSRLYFMLILGILVQLAFQTNFGIQYIQTMILPFLLTEIAIIYYERSSGFTIGDRFGYLSALQLYGFSNDTIWTSRYVMTIMSTVIDDFSFYFFAFVVVLIFI